MEATLFDFPKLEITNKIRLIELFGGIGSQAMALRDIGANFERLTTLQKLTVVIPVIFYHYNTNSFYYNIIKSFIPTISS